MFTMQSAYVHGAPRHFAEVNDDTVPSYLWPGGYPAEYLTPDCAVLCGSCARRAYLDEADADHDNAIAGKLCGPSEAHDESDDHSGIQCEGCNQWIVEPEPITAPKIARILIRHRIDNRPSPDQDYSPMRSRARMARNRSVILFARKLERTHGFIAAVYGYADHIAVMLPPTPNRRPTAPARRRRWEANADARAGAWINHNFAR